MNYVRPSHLTNKGDRRGKLGISRSALYRLIAAGKFPKPVHPLPGVSAWLESTVDAWMLEQVA